jgi:hypothetical protein
MTSSVQKKAKHQETTSAPAAQDPTPAKAVVPALIAYYAMPVPQGQQPVLSPIGAAIAHDDGEGFTLQLHLMPPVGGHIVLRKPQVKKAA